MSESNIITDDMELTGLLTIRNISSTNFIIETKSIIDLEKQVKLLTSMGTCGMITYGRARIGKTRAIIYIANGMKKKYGEQFPVIVWTVTDHPNTEKNFYASLLMAMGVASPNKGATALILKERVLNELIIRASNTMFKQVIFFIDEAWKFDEKDFAWLMDLYNILVQRDIILSAFLFGTRELKDLKSVFKSQGKDQIVGRFMAQEMQFHGLKSVEELGLCLMTLDKKYVTTYIENYKNKTLAEFYFPEAYRDNKGKFYTLTIDYWDAFQIIRAKYNIQADDIPMKYLLDSFVMCLMKYGILSDNRVYFPSKENLLDCIELSAYGESDDEYERRKNNKRN